MKKGSRGQCRKFNLLGDVEMRGWGDKRMRGKEDKRMRG